MLKLTLYFLVGGLIVSSVTYFGVQGRSLLSAFIATFPSITVLTFILVYLNGGLTHTLSYAKGMVLFLPGWLVYLFTFVWAVPRLGFWPALSLALANFFIVVGMIQFWAGR
jgi:hypothetical protein